MCASESTNGTNRKCSGFIMASGLSSVGAGVILLAYRYLAVSGKQSN